MFQFTVLPPLSLYIHIPWCVRKCPYCDFNSHALREELPERDYVAALLRDLEQDLPRVWGRSVQSVFIGGGTPSLFSAETIDSLLTGIRARITLVPDAEITLEANPGTVEAGRFAEYRHAGINRLSIGVQSFADDMLAKLGRIHSRREAYAAAEQAHGAGLENFNLDLMFGLPRQTTQQALADLHEALALEPAHLSWYQLTIEPNTAFATQPPELPNNDALFAMQQDGQSLLAEHGYDQYEVSAYARPGRQCRHNLNYWQFGDYLGIGAGAHGKLSSTAPAGITRLWKLRHPRDYQERAGTPQGIGGETALTDRDAVFDFMLFALRLNSGFDLALFEHHTSLPRDSVLPTLQQAAEQGFLELDRDKVTPTEKGRLFLNDLLHLFLES